MQTGTADLIIRARAGDHDAFRDLVQGHSPELPVHCHRILGSLSDAEDALPAARGHPARTRRRRRRPAAAGTLPRRPARPPRRPAPRT